MFRFTLILLVASIFGACGSGSSNEQPQEEKTDNSTAPTYPSISQATLQKLWNECDYVDYVFYDLPISMNQSDQPSIRGAIRQIAQESPIINPNCKSIGRIFYQIKGENYLEADLYFASDCVYFLFLEDGKPKYANRLTAEAIQFYQNIFKQLQNAGQSGQ